MDSLMYALDQLPAEMPTNTITACEYAVEIIGADLADSSTSLTGLHLTTVVLRLYRQGDQATRVRCLDVIDRLFEFKQVRVHRVVASKDLQLPETVKRGADGGSFTLLAEPDCLLTENDAGELTVELLACNIFDPSTGQPRSSDLNEVDCWMIDTNHDGCPSARG